MKPKELFINEHSTFNSSITNILLSHKVLKSLSGLVLMLVFMLRGSCIKFEKVGVTYCLDKRLLEVSRICMTGTFADGCTNPLCSVVIEACTF